MKRYYFKNIRTKKISDEVVAYSLVEAEEQIGIGWTLYRIDK